MSRIFHDVAAAFQFLTRLPLPRLSYQTDSLSRTAKFFPLVGLALGGAVAGIYFLLSPHLPPLIVALAIVLFSALATGGMHEDGLADVADAFGGGWNKQKTLEIMRDSCIGSYGALAIVFSIAARVLLLANLPSENFVQYAIAAEVISRWTVLPLGMALPAARKEAGLGTHFARQISGLSLAVGTLLMLAIVGYCLRVSMWTPVVAASIVTLLSGLYYKRRIDGVTGDCFGATIQLSLIAVYFCGVWRG
jgi:adenosylcobinamide-GDP ribazoletransferase